MAIKRNKPEEIVTKLRQVEVLVGQGKARIDAIRHGLVSQNPKQGPLISIRYFRSWRPSLGGTTLKMR